MGFTEMAELAKKFPPFAEEGYTGSFLDRVEVVFDVRDAEGNISKYRGTLGKAWDGWSRAGSTPEQATTAVMRVLQNGGAPEGALTQSWNYLGSAKEVLDELERVYSGKQHSTWTAKERDALIFGDGKQGGLREKWNLKWKYLEQALGKSIDYWRKQQIVGPSNPVVQARGNEGKGTWRDAKEEAAHPGEFRDVWNATRKFGRSLRKSIFGGN